MSLEVKERSQRFYLALCLKGVALDLADENSQHLKTLKDAYDAIAPFLQPMRLKQLKDTDLDHRFIEALEHYIMPYHRIISQHSEDYWDNLKRMGDTDDFEEFRLLKIRKADLVKFWQATYSKKRKTEEEVWTDQ